jgi:RNA polymerase sigma factor (sigma-70 family)
VSYSTTKTTESTNRFHQAQDGDAESVAELMSEHDGLVHYIVRQQWRGTLSYARVLHEGRIGLWRAILGFDPERGVAFSSYASVAITRHVWRAVAQAKGERQGRDSWPLVTQSTEPLLDVLEWEVEAVLRALVEQLPAKQRWVVRAYYGLDGQGGRTLAQVGQQLGCTRQAVHYHLHKALVSLRHPVFSAVLRALLGRNRREDYLQALRSERRRR